jgi:hypothetical protein
MSIDAASAEAGDAAIKAREWCRMPAWIRTREGLSRS